MHSVLFVDDDQNILDAYKRNLRKYFDVHTAISGVKALELIDENHEFSVIISDMQMPNMNGIELLIIAKKMSKNSVRIMLTGNGDQQTAIDAINQGSIYKFVSKPCSPEKMLDILDIAINHYIILKAESEKNSKLYSSGLRGTTLENLDIENEIRTALENNEFLLYYQPKIDPKDGLCKGAEALIRWNHPKKGFISPSVFIPIAENSDLIIQIGYWVRETVFEHIAMWRMRGLPFCEISINVSGVEFKNNIVQDHLKVLLNKYAIPPEYIELEITEGTLIEYSSKEIDSWAIIRSLGVNLSIDDFGTGYCSFSYLIKYPVNTIKIDRIFVSNVINGERNSSIVRAIITMAHSLGMKVVAEGVETENQKNMLLVNQCNLIQGYYYSRPLDTQGFEKYL
jgi:EAL domain-containing protein (putative c-di-GMP-specific phosphodiesterase class I)/FixJ family two-component response regulator